MFARAGGVLALDLDGVLFVWPEPAGVAGGAHRALWSFAWYHCGRCCQKEYVQR